MKPRWRSRQLSSPGGFLGKLLDVLPQRLRERESQHALFVRTSIINRWQAPVDRICSKGMLLKVAQYIKYATRLVNACADAVKKCMLYIPQFPRAVCDVVIHHPKQAGL